MADDKLRNAYDDVRAAPEKLWDLHDIFYGLATTSDLTDKYEGLDEKADDVIGALVDVMRSVEELDKFIAERLDG